jgi:Rrf2 family iron-sulfur cluster assembly transcriptional regulator
MYLPQTCEYALRAMAHMVTLAGPGGIRAQDLAVQTGIPAAYLSKILRKLVEAGLLGSQKGHGGGFTLARPADRITLLDVLKATDYEADPADCAFGWDACDPQHPCPLHPAWSELKMAFSDWAAGTTLASIRDAFVGPKAKATLARRGRKPAKAKPRRAAG